MAIKLKHSDTYSTYFITFTCIEWISLFDISKTHDTVYNWFAVLKDEVNADIIAYVIMPNHRHVLWEQLKMNGKETPKASFEKYTGHIFLNNLELRKKI